jgi:peptidyl-prolyl cis-trans isomerase SurA
MTSRHTNPGFTFAALLLAFAIAAPARAQTPAAPQGTLVDQVIAVVNGDLILESDVDEERRFEAFEPLRDAQAPTSRDALIHRLIDRTLILQQAKLQPGDRVTLPEAQAQLATLRKDIPACKEFHCETDAGWQKFVQSHGFTVPQIEEFWRSRMEVLRFIEIRFRAGIRIAPDEIKAYYDKTLVPELARSNTPPPPLDSVSDRIQEILLQQRVGSLLTDWLSSLKAQGTVRIIKPGEEAP